MPKTIISTVNFLVEYDKDNQPEHISQRSDCDETKWRYEQRLKQEGIAYTHVNTGLDISKENYADMAVKRNYARVEL